MDFTPRSRPVLSARAGTPRPETPNYNQNSLEMTYNETQYTQYGKTPNLVRRIRNARNDIGELGREAFMDQRDVSRLPFLLDNRLEEVPERFTNFMNNFVTPDSENRDNNRYTRTRLGYYLEKLVEFIKENLHEQGAGYSTYLPFEVDMNHVYNYDPVLYKLLVTFPADCIAELDRVVLKSFNEMLSKHYSDVTLENNAVFPRARLMNKPHSDCVGNLDPSMADSLVQFSGTVVRQTWIVPEITMACFRCRGQRKVRLNETEKCTCEQYEYVIQGEVNEPVQCPECNNKYTFELNHNMSVYSTKKLVKLLQVNTTNNVVNGMEGMNNGAEANSSKVANGEAEGGKTEEKKSTLNIDELGEVYLKDNEIVSLNLYDDLVDSVSTGDRVTVVGILKVTPCRSSTTKRTLKTLYNYFVNVIHVKVVNSTQGPTRGLKYQGSENEFSDVQVEKIMELARNPMVYKILMDSFAPSIKARNNVKIGLLCQLFSCNPGNKESYKADNFRGIINVLLCGDPGTAKSQLLHYTHLLSPRSIYTSGKSSSSVGLTASIKFSEGDNGRAMIQPGAVVLANGGVCCIDELDKSHHDARLSLYEVMEQQTVTIAKAGIVATLKAETAILASCNPINSRYDKSKAVIENINIAPSLFTRFDLIYLVLDHIDRETDEMISTSIARDFLKPLQMAENGENSTETGRNRDSGDNRGRTERDEEGSDSTEDEDMKMSDLDLMRLYIKFAKLHCFPELSEEAKKVITREYIRMREGNYQSTANEEQLDEESKDLLNLNTNNNRMIYVSSRMISSIIRIGVALARMRLSSLVTKEDAMQAVQIVKSSTFQSLVDPTTGKIDFDQLHQGITTNKMQQMNQIHEQIMDLFTKSAEQDSTKLIELNELINMLSKSSGQESGVTDRYKEGERYREGEGYKMVLEVLNKMQQEGTVVKENNSYRLKRLFSLMTKDLNLEEGPEEWFWQSDLYTKSYFKDRKHKKYLYYDTACFIKYLFFHWLTKWVNNVTYEHVQPYKLHPLPVSDQILRWQPIFSKHVSDGLVRLEEYETSKSVPGKKKAKRPYRSLLFRALLLTIWKRALVVIIGLILVNVLSMSISILVKKLVVKLGDKSINIKQTVGLLVAIIACIFHHALCYRRKFSNNVNGTNTLNVCNQVLHTCSPDSECSKNPLYCQALRYQNKEINPKVFYFEFKDSYYFSQSFNAIKIFIEFATNFSYGIFLLRRQIKMKMWVLYVVGIVFTFLMIFVELLSAITIKFLLYMRDFKMSKCNYMFPYLSLIKKMFYDDIAVNIITHCRNNELTMIVINIFLTFLNLTMFSACINVSFYLIQYAFVKSVRGVNVVTDIDTAGFMAAFYIFLKIAISMFMVPRAIKVCGVAFVSFKRFEEYVRECAPNFYISDNKFVPATNMNSNVAQVTNQLPNDTVVYYKNASFTWVNTRNDLLNKNYEPYLKNINFELKRGEMVIVTGVLGSGKSNFIKSMLGEMTLVGGSMAVVPLHTSMPIFYASEDIFLQHGTVRSNIVFGHKFDEQLYNTVLKAVELEYDISTWKKGDLRVLSDNALSLSGGQRVRMELARAVYAYLVFHRVNKEYNNSQCSFLMCLDFSLHGLDPYVSKTVFNNLFNLKTGLLIKNDLSVVLTSSKQGLQTCLNPSDANQFHNLPIYNVKNKELRFCSNLHDFMKNNKVESEDYKYISTSDGVPYNMSYLSNDMLKLCSSYGTTRLGRMEVTRSKYSKSFKSYVKNELAGVRFNSYLTYMLPAAGAFTLYIIFNTSVNIMDTLKFVFATRTTDFIGRQIKQFKDGEAIDLDLVKSRANLSLKVTTMFVSLIIILSFLATLIMTTASVVSSRKLHEYTINSIFNCSSAVLKIKKNISQVITYLAADMIIIDDSLAFFLGIVLFLFLQFLTNIVTLFYLIPISIPFVFVALVFILYFVMLRYVRSNRSLFLSFMETSSHVISVYEKAIAGSSVYRSYERFGDLLKGFTEHRDYKGRNQFMMYSMISWSNTVFNWIFSLTTLTVLVIPIVLDKYTKYKMKVGYFALALSLCMNINNTFIKLALNIGLLDIDMCFVRRFRYFIPPGQRLRFSKFVNAHEENVVNPTNRGTVINKAQLMRRRAIEFKNENKRFYALRRLFYHPKLHILDDGRYLTSDHSGVELKNVCVYTTPERTRESMILKNITVLANKSEIIGMVGRTGAGKTTLLSVLQNISTNRTGQVLLDGIDLNDIPKVVLRQIIGVLPQLPFVFKGWTIRRFLDPRKLFSDDEINQALSKCGLLNFVNELSGGRKLNNQSDMLLSNTQLRTLSLARLVLYRHFFRLIVVDEPPEEDTNEETSSRNDDLAVPIYDILQKHFSHCTTFVTAHDVNVLKSCTSVWVIHEGCVVKTCKASDVSANESIASIIEQYVKKTKLI
ncbi:cell division control protein [Theileria orientalis strain Shintoku]|uniref:DNA helicase n=1 Tax=Theileria orientalis strain Shintoku TaxID=869250 RepID=J7MH40_THEOR|nr:cell division control protein [Theileria orientalis strain Shintoku]BAM42521.1 cell division control protein [Theileria orientalis strain Shintoku]|eukprot:XP_009692822.1 cell division control protein [Theileria orientalis strain Shintoku]